MTSEMSLSLALTHRVVGLSLTSDFCLLCLNLNLTSDFWGPYGSHMGLGAFFSIWVRGGFEKMHRRIHESLARAGAHFR